MGRFNIVCVDKSHFSENAFNWYVDNYHQAEDTIGLIHVHQMPAYPSSFGIMGYGGKEMIQAYHKQIEESVAEAKVLLTRFKDICTEKGLKNRTILADSVQSPGHAICEVIEKENATAIFMGQRGLGAISRMLVGSTSDYVLHHSNCPVIVIPASFKEEKKE